MGPLSQLLEFASGRAFRPAFLDLTVPLGQRCEGRRLLCVDLQPGSAEVLPVRFPRRGPPRLEPAFLLPAPADGLPDAAWVQDLFRRHPGRDVALLLPTSDVQLRRVVNFAAPPGLFDTVLATRPEAIAGPLRPGRAVAGFRDPERPVALLAEGPASAIERTTAAFAVADRKLARLQCPWLAALDLALFHPAIEGTRAIVIQDRQHTLVVPLAPDGTWEPPLVLPGTIPAWSELAPLGYPQRVLQLVSALHPEPPLDLPAGVEPLGPDLTLPRPFLLACQ